MFLDVNLFAVFIAAAAAMGIGMLWYSPAVFGKAWIALSGFTPERIAEAKSKGMGKTYAAALACCVLLSGGYSLLAYLAAIDTRAGAFKLAAVLWTGFVLPVLAASVLWEGKPVRLFLINAGHYLAALLAVAAVQSFL
jgi:hypothetical protein